MKQRGFTLIELMIVIAILPVIIGAIGIFYVEGRVASARIEAQVNLTRRLSLTHELLARDLVGADLVTPKPDGVHIQRGALRIIYTTGAQGLVRSDAEQRLALSPHIHTLNLKEQSDGYAITLAARRTLLKGRAVKLERQTFIGRRR